MAAQRKHDEENQHVIAWVAAGTAVGLIAGALVAERLSGRKLTLRSLFDRGRALATRASARWEPLVDAAIGVRDAWQGNGEAEEEFEEEELDGDDDLDEDDLDEEDDLEDEDDEESDDELDVDAELDELDEDDEDDEDEGEDDEDEDRADDEVTALDARVLVAFSNDPVLASRNVEIEQAEDDEIVLHGRVHTAREVAHAVTIARGVPGVAAVRQELTVRDRR